MAILTQEEIEKLALANVFCMRNAINSVLSHYDSKAEATKNDEMIMWHEELEFVLEGLNVVYYNIYTPTNQALAAELAKLEDEQDNEKGASCI